MTHTGWSVDGFARYWARPEPHDFERAVTEDVAGYWPGSSEPVRGRAAYAERIAQLLRLLPGMRAEVTEHGSRGDVTFVSWVLHARGRHGAFELPGVDRVRLRDGRVAENVILFDGIEFERRSGYRLPWREPSHPVEVAPASTSTT
jgi:hypothetical protein